MKRKAIDKRRKYTKEEMEYILSKTGGKCAHCGKPLTIKTMQKDHSIPWSKGGPSNVENIVPLCKECNIAKADRVRSAHLYKRWIEFYSADNMIPAYEYADKLGLFLL